MILPTKCLRVEESLLGLGGMLLGRIVVARSLSDLWEEWKSDFGEEGYERFILTLDLLYILGAVEFKDNRIARVEE